MGREDPIEFDRVSAYLLFVFVALSGNSCFVGVMGGIIFNSSLFLYIYLYFFDPFIMIIRLNYLRDNSVIFLESSYWRGGLRPRCWIKVNSRCRS